MFRSSSSLRDVIRANPKSPTLMRLSLVIKRFSPLRSLWMHCSQYVVLEVGLTCRAWRYATARAISVANVSRRRQGKGTVERIRLRKFPPGTCSVTMLMSTAFEASALTRRGRRQWAPCKDRGRGRCLDADIPSLSSTLVQSTCGPGSQLALSKGTHVVLSGRVNLFDRYVESEVLAFR